MASEKKIEIMVITHGWVIVGVVTDDARNLAQAEEHDAASWVDEPIDYTVVDQPAEYDGIDRAPEDTSDLWESCFGSDPEAPHVCLDDDAINAFAIEQSATRRVIRSLDRAAGAR